MVEINITYFIQMLNFLLAWAILDRFFFRYVVKIVQKEEKTLKGVRRSIVKERELLTQEQASEAKQWKASRASFKKSAPNVEAISDFSYLKISYPPLDELTPARKQELIQDTQQAVIEEVLENG